MRCGLLAILAVLCVSAQATGDYELSLIAEGQVSVPVINNSGDIVFRTGAFANIGGISSPDGPIISIGDEIEGRVLSSMGSALFNDAGTVAFSARFTDGSRGIATPDRIIVEIGDTIDGLEILDIHSPSLNALGDVVFTGGIAGGGAVFTQDEYVAGPFTVIDDKILEGCNWPDINDAQDMVFVGHWESRSGVFTRHELIWESGGVIDGVTIESVSPPEINNAGQVFMKCSTTTDVTVLTSLSTVYTRTGDTVDGYTLDSLGDFSVNNVGTIAFSAELEGTLDSAIFTPDGVVAAPGVILDGGMLARSFRFPSINDDGDIVFQAEFLDGRSAIILATWISPADFDRDGNVDGDDFLIWQTDFGLLSCSTGGCDGDADFDGDVDGDDFLIWQSEFGSGSGSASAAVPEPTSVVLLLAAFSCILLWRCRPGLIPNR